jgi:hypothetical protein
VRRIIKAIAGVLAAFLVLAIGYAVWGLWWEGRQIRSFCDAVHPGDAVSSLQDLGASHGVAARRLKGIFAKDGGYWYLTVPVAATMGDCGCRITHDGKVVLSANMSCH